MKQWSILLVFLSLSLSLSAQQGYEKDVFVSSTGDSLPYRMIRPESMKAGKKYPAFVLVPQCPAGSYWAYTERPKSLFPADMPAGQEMSSLTRTLKQLLDTYLAMPEVDKKRIYIVGLSMGAMGTYDLVVRYPEIFAAAVPICGSVNPDRLPVAKEVKFRIFHGDADDVVTVEGSREAYKALKAAGAKVEYIEFPGCNHGSWNPAFNYPGFMEWLFKQKK